MANEPHESWIASQWKQLRGHAKWSLLEKLCAWGWPMIVGAATGLIAWIKQVPFWESVIAITIVGTILGVIPMFLVHCVLDIKRRRGLQKGNSQIESLRIKADIVNRLSSESPRYFCEITMENQSDKETLTNLSIGIESFKLLPELDNGYGNNAPRRGDFPLNLAQPIAVSISPKQDSKLELFKIVRTPEPTIEICSRTFRLHNALKLQFIIAVSADNMRQTQWRIEMDSIKDAIGVPTLSIRTIERINL
jgi:hypothetical protein